MPHVFSHVYPTDSGRKKVEPAGGKPNPSRRKRIWAIAGIVGLSLGGVGWYALQTQQSPLCLIQQCEPQTKTVTVLVAEFDGVEAKNYRVTEIILLELQKAEGISPNVRIRPLRQAISQQDGKDKARKLGKAKNADIVIWGWYGKTQEKAIVSVNFEMLSEAKDYLDLGKQAQGEVRTMKVDLLDSIEMQANLAQELEYLTLVTSGMSAYAVEDWDTAIARLTLVLSEAEPNKAVLDPADIYLYRGNTYRRKGEYDLAIIDYSKAITLNPQNAVFFNNRGNAYIDKEEYDLAIIDYSKAITLNPKYAEAFYNRGIAYHSKEKYDCAIDDYSKAITLNPKDAETFYNRGIAYRRKGKYDLAIDDYSKAITLNPKDAEAFNNRGIAYHFKKEYNLAISDFRKAITLNPKSAYFFNNRCDTYNYKGEYNRAISDCNEALKLNPGFATAFITRGKAYELKGNKEKAIEDYRQALSIAQDLKVKESAQSKLKEIEGK